jgi:AraC family transcriptional regulator
MTDRSAHDPSHPLPPLRRASGDRPPLLDLFTVPVPSGPVDSPLEDRHVVDMHLGEPVHVSCRMDGRERRGLQTHGLFTVVPAGEMSRWMLARSARALIVRLVPSLLRETAEAMGLGARDAELVPSIHVRDPQVERIAWILQAEHDAGYPSGRVFIDSLGSALAARLLGLQSGSGAETSRPGRALPRWRLSNVLDYIEAHLDDALTLAELATVAGFSLSHFKSLFKQAVGVPVHRYVLERRVERARTLLLEGGRSMVDIALEAGFTHQSHMARCMRRVLGLSPSQVADSSR